jgi:probable HAF family extracellular repeat protein
LEDRWLLSYTFRLLGALGGSESMAQAIRGGNVVGEAAVDGSDVHAVLWSARTYAPRDLGTLGGPNSAALAVNDAGTVVGWANDSPDPTQTAAFIWDRTGGMQSLGLDGVATAINDLGQVVGQTAEGQAFVLQGSAPLVLTNLAGRSRASAINNAGMVAGWDDIDLHGHGLGHYRVGHAWIWENGTQTDLGVLPIPGPPQHSEAYALTDAGQVVGQSGIFRSKGPHQGWLVSHAFLWQADQGMIDLGTLADGGNTAAYAINKAGDVVGTSGGRAFLYHAGVMIDLNQFSPLVGPHDVLAAATGINDAGQIVGYATIGGTTEAFVLKPDVIVVPPPLESLAVALGEVQPVSGPHLRRLKTEFVTASRNAVALEADSSVTTQVVPVSVHLKRVRLAHPFRLPADGGPVEDVAVADGLTLALWGP